MEDTYVIGWGTLALITAGLAQGKIAPGLIGFLLSLPLGLLATFFLLLVKNISIHYKKAMMREMFVL